MKLKRARIWLAQLLERGDRLGLVSKQRWIGMNKNTHAFLPILCERGTDESVLIIAFSGGAQKLDVPVHEFFETTKTLGYNRILLWDRYYMYYHYGVDRDRRDWPSLLGYLKQEIARLQPKKFSAWARRREAMLRSLPAIISRRTSSMPSVPRPRSPSTDTLFDMRATRSIAGACPFPSAFMEKRWI